MTDPLISEMAMHHASMDNIPQTPKATFQATEILSHASFCIGDRAADRDTDSERSMAACVNAFNAMYGHNLTETEGWQFMVFLKISRSKGGNVRMDDYIDGAAYLALAGECASKGAQK